MEIDITEQLGSLAHPKRLALLRMLIRRYPDDVPAGELASSLDLKANTASNYLSALKQVGLVTQARQGTSLRYRANTVMLHTVFDELLEGCCQNRPDICQRPFRQMSIGSSAEQPLNVLFLCMANSARSIMAESLLNRIGAGRFNVFSAGIAPAKEPNTKVLDFLVSKGCEVDGLKSKSMESLVENLDREMDFVITVCDQAANEEPVKWPGYPMHAHWGTDDPLSHDSPPDEDHAIERTYETINARVLAFAALPFDELNQLQLQQKLDQLGQWTGPE